MRAHPAGAGCDDPVRRVGTAGRVLRWQALSSYPSSAPVRKAFSADARRPVSHANSLHSADLASEAAETLRSARGGGPASSGEAAVTEGPEGPEREAVRLAVGADVCGAAGCRRTDGLLVVPTAHGRRVLCPLHARRVLA